MVRHVELSGSILDCSSTPVSKTSKQNPPRHLSHYIVNLTELSSLRPATNEHNDLSPQPHNRPNPSPQLAHVRRIPILHPRSASRVLNRSSKQVLHALLHRTPRQALVDQRHRFGFLRTQLISAFQSATTKLVGHALQLAKVRFDLQFSSSGKTLH